MTGDRENRTEMEVAKARTCLDKILASPCFVQSERLQRFLRFIVTETMAGHTDRLKGYAIGVEVFDRDETFDPGIDAIVRVEAVRLRAKLREYYELEGRSDPLRFDLPKGSYAIRMEWRALEPSPSTSPPRESRGALVETAGDAIPARLRPIEDRPSLVVLPFTNMSADPEQEYFVDGITDGLITELSCLPGLFVISRHSSFVYKGVSKRAEEIGAELGVRYLVEGGVQRSGDRVRITAQLIDTTSGAYVWAERYDRELKDIFAVQDDVTRRIVAVLQVKLAGVERDRLGHGGTANIEAHDSLLRGLEGFWVFTPETVEQARAQFTRVVELDPSYAAGYAWLARALVFQWIMLWSVEANVLERALEHARRAVDLDERLPLAHSMLGWVLLWRHQGEASIAAGWRAISLDPNNADAHMFLAFSLVALGRGEEALHYIEKAIRLNPHPSAVYMSVLGLSYFVLEEYDKAIAAFKRGTELTDVFIPCHFWLCLTYTLQDREEDARSEREKLLALTGGRKPMLRQFWLDEDFRIRADALAKLAGLAEEHSGLIPALPATQ